MDGRFKIGDPVRRIRCNNAGYGGLSVGETGVIQSYGCHSDGIMVRSDKTGEIGYHERRNLELVKAEPSPVRTVTKTVKEIVPGKYGPVVVEDNGEIGVLFAQHSARDLTDIIGRLTAIRDALEDE